MNVVDDLIAQRDAVLFGQWVPRPPREDGEACAVVRIVRPTERSEFKVTLLRTGSGDLLDRAFRNSEWSRRYPYVVKFNNSGEATREDILGLLDEAIRIAKAEVPKDTSDAS